jgi:hypothetical protein
MVNNIDIAHAFFYSGDYENYKNYKNLGYRGNKFFSYSTIIGKKITGKDGNTYLFLSDNTFSNTTAKHIDDLKHASPLDIIKIPVNYSQRDITIDGVIDDILYNLDYYAKSKLTLKNNRESYIKYFNMLIDIDEKIQTIKKSIINKYQPLFDTLNNSESIKQLKLKIAENEKKAREKLKRKISRYLKKYNLSQLAKMVYDYNDKTLQGEKDIKQAIKQYINPNDDLSFVWVDGDNFKTSKHITIAKKDCEVIIKLFKAGKLKHGLKLCYYTILQVTSDFIKIGCHKIPVENINNLI